MLWANTNLRLNKGVKDNDLSTLKNVTFSWDYPLIRVFPTKTLICKLT